MIADHGEEASKRFIEFFGDRAYDSDPLDQRLLKADTIMTAPHKRNCKQKNSRWQRNASISAPLGCRAVVYLVAKLSSYRHDYKLCNYKNFVVLGCIIILTRRYFETACNNLLGLGGDNE